MTKRIVLSALVTVSVIKATNVSAQYLPPPPPPPGVGAIQRQLEGSVDIQSITRQSGGQWYRVLLAEPVALDLLEVQVLQARVKIHDASVVTQSRQRVSIQELRNTPVFGVGSKAVSERLAVAEKIIAVDLLMESYGNYADVRVVATSLSGRPRLVLDGQQMPPAPPARPPVYNDSLSGFCADNDHQQFYAAKQFAFSGDGLNYSDAGATNWALNYNQSHRCNTINEYAARFRILVKMAYDSDSLDYSRNAAQNYALSLVETTNVNEANRLAIIVKAARSFAYNADGLNYSSQAASTFARQWIEQRCEDQDRIRYMHSEFRKHYQFAYSANGLNYSSLAATKYAANKIAPLTRCSNLLPR